MTERSGRVEDPDPDPMALREVGEDNSEGHNMDHLEKPLKPRGGLNRHASSREE
jgi:hypothetical protein